MAKQTLTDHVLSHFLTKFAQKAFNLGYELHAEIVNRTIIARITPISIPCVSFQSIQALLEIPFDGYPVCVHLDVKNMQSV